jgi:hypothetical protein
MSQNSTGKDKFSTLNIRFTMKAPHLLHLQEFYAKLETLIIEEQFAVIATMSMDYNEEKDLDDLFTKDEK